MVAIAVNLFAPIPPPTSAQSFVFSDIGSVLGRPVLWLCSLLLFLYVACEVGVWNWLVQHLIAQGVPQVRALNVLSFGFALGLLFGRLAASQILISVSRTHGHTRCFRFNGDHDIRDVANPQSNCRLDLDISSRHVHGPGLSRLPSRSSATFFRA